MKKIFLFMIIAFLCQIQHLNCQLITTINYQENPISDNFLLSFDLGRQFNYHGYGVFDEFKAINFASGVRIIDNKPSFAFDLDLFSYLSLFRFPLFADNDQDHLYLDDMILTHNNGNVYITLSYKGIELSNLKIYQKDYNWSSAGIDLLFKNFETHNFFYSRFPYVVTASTIQNNKDYFKDIDIPIKPEFCLDTKINNFTKLSFRNDYCELQLETYYRIIYNDLNQKEFGVNLEFDHSGFYPWSINTQIGYIHYGVGDTWKNLGFFNLGLSYFWRWNAD